MEMTPRRRGRPRKASPVVNVTVGGTPEVETGVDAKKVSAIEARVAQLEAEKGQLLKELERRDMQEKGISTEALQTRSIGSKEDILKLEQKIATCERELKGGNPVIPGGNIVPGKLTVTQQNLSADGKQEALMGMLKAKRGLARMVPPKVTDKEKNVLLERKRELEKVLRDRRRLMGDFWDVKNGYEFARTVDLLAAYNSECGKMVQELKNINRILEPDNRHAGNLGYLDENIKHTS